MAERDAARFAGELSIAVAAFDIYSTEGQIAYDLGELEEAEQDLAGLPRARRGDQQKWPDQAREPAGAGHRPSQPGHRARAGTAAAPRRSSTCGEAIAEEDAMVAARRKHRRPLAACARPAAVSCRGRSSARASSKPRSRCAGNTWAISKARRRPSRRTPPSSTTWRSARGFVAGLALVRGEFEAADQGYRSGSEAMAKLAAADPENARLALWMTRFHSTPPSCGRRSAKPRARAGLDAAQEILDPLRQGKADLPDLVEAQGLIFLRRGLVDEEAAPEKALADAGQPPPSSAKLLPNADASQRTALANAELLRGRVLARARPPGRRRAGFRRGRGGARAAAAAAVLGLPARGRARDRLLPRPPGRSASDLRPARRHGLEGAAPAAAREAAGERPR